MARNIRVVKDAENPESPEVLAASIIRIADGFERLMDAKNGLTQEGVVALLLDMPQIRSKVGKREINLVLDNLKKLRGYYVRRSVNK